MSEWINVKDKLPKENENVILFDGNEVFCGDISLDRYGNICPGMQGCDGICYGWCNKSEIKYWMPLPFPPN